MMKRYDIINDIIKVKNYKSYLEIGVRDTPKNFGRIQINRRVGVDPEPRLLKLDKKRDTFFELTSDEFFKQNNDKFDIIFIDGMHTDEQVTKDINNSLDALNEGGCIVMHDCNPADEHRTRSYEQYAKEKKTTPWNGTVWKAFVRMRNRSDVEQFCVSTDHGVGFIQKGHQEPLNIKEEDLVYSNFDRNRTIWLNLVSPNTFKSWVNG